MASGLMIPSGPSGCSVQLDNSQWMYSRWLPVIPSREKVSVRRPISSSFGRRKSLRSLGQPARTTDRQPPSPSITSISRLSPVRASSLRAWASSMNRATGRLLFFTNSLQFPFAVFCSSRNPDLFPRREIVEQPPQSGSPV
ncbi:MAG: hypothetical protein MZV64_71555 [Ignavibacteriales bacterium]|nr:hypothetical protein [Ignavibacteriales bacterium]